MNKIIFLLMIVMVPSTMLEAMSMKPKQLKCSVAKKKQQLTDKEIRANKKNVRQIVKETREVDALLQAIKEKSVNPSILNATRAFARAIGCEENGLIEACLQAGADPNRDIFGSGRPLEIVERLRNIELLLRYKADPKLCVQSPLIKSLFYYMLREKESPPRGYDDSKHQAYNERCRQEKQRLADKALKCIKLLLQAGANANQEGCGIFPLRAIVKLTEDSYLSRQKAKEMVKALVAHGANPDHPGIKNYIANSQNYAYELHKSVIHELACYMREERHQYQANQAVRQLLIGHYKNAESPLSLLPKDILKVIGILVKNGFSFRPIGIVPEKLKEMPLRLPNVPVQQEVIVTKDEENKNISANEQQQSQTVEQPKNNALIGEVNTLSEIPKEHSEPAPLNVTNLQKAKENIPDKSISFNKPYRSPIILGNPKVLFTFVVSNIAYWSYVKWKNKRKKSEETYDLDTKTPRHLLSRHPKKIVRY